VILFVVICFAVGFALLWFVVIKPAREEVEREAHADVLDSDDDSDDDSSVETPPNSGPRSRLD
jgi:hypothetical protein